MNRLFTIAIVASFLVQVGVSSDTQAQIVNGDFTINSLTNNTVVYEDINGGWHSKNAGSNWQILGGALEQTGNNGSATRAGQVFTTGAMNGTGWFLNFELADNSLSRVQVFGGVDDLTGNTGNNVLAFGGDGSPDNGIVVGSWDTLIDQSGINPGTQSYSITQDLSSYDLLAVRFRGTGATVGAKLDNVEFSTTPPVIPPLVQGLVNGDFSDSSITRNGNAKYGDLGEGWVGKNAFDGDGGTADNWEITGGQLVQVGSSGSATRVGQLLRADDMMGTGWTFDFDLIGDDITRLQIFAGVDDGNNLIGENVLAMGGDGSPTASIVDVNGWTTLLDEASLTPDSYSFDILEDLSAFDLIAVRFRGNGGTVGATIDNVAFVSPFVAAVPEPHSIAIWALFGLGLCGFAFYRRRCLVKS